MTRAGSSIAHRLTVIYLIRHGETAWNVEEVFRGRADLPLNRRGRRQAHAIASTLEDEPVAAVYSSPLRRAVATACPLARAHGLTVTPDDRLTDLDFGDWEGISLAAARERWPRLFARWQRNPGAVTFPRGENLAAVRERALEAVTDIVARHVGETVAVVSHRVVNKVVLLAILGLDDSHFWRLRQDTGCINRIERGQTWVIASLNDRCHLRGLGAGRGPDF